MILPVGTAFVHTPSGIFSSNNFTHAALIRAKVSVAVVIALCLLLIPRLWADDLKEYIYLDGRLVVVETRSLGNITPIIPTITSFTLRTDSPSPQLSDGNKRADLTIGRTVTLSWSSQNAQFCSLSNKGNANSDNWNPSNWTRWADVEVSGSRSWVSTVTGTDLQFQLSCSSTTYHEATAVVAMNIYPLPSVTHSVSPYEQIQSGSFYMSGTRSNVTAGFTGQCGYELAKYNNTNRNSGRTIVAGQYPVPANGAWSGSVSANQSVGNVYSTVSFCLNNDGVYSINEQPVDIISCYGLVQSCMAQIDCFAECEANAPPNCWSAGGACMDWYNSCGSSCQTAAEQSCNLLCR